MPDNIKTAALLTYTYTGKMGQIQQKLGHLCLARKYIHLDFRLCKIKVSFVRQVPQFVREGHCPRKTLTWWRWSLASTFVVQIAPATS